MLFLYSQVYEAQEKYVEAIEKLNQIENNSTDSGGTDDNLYSKSLLNLGRLYFKQGNNEMANKNLNKFFKESKKHESKELLDLARVNLGMIKGDMSFKELIQKAKTTDYQEFLKAKLKYFDNINS